jgi:predicted GH43/DUF377 family glycosyl hydrolase
MGKKVLNVRRMEEKFFADRSRIIAKFYRPGGQERVLEIIKRVLSIPEREVKAVLKSTIADFAQRHKNIWSIFDRNFNAIKEYIPTSQLSDARRALMGACFTNEYSIQSAAFFNPSIVPHFDQSGLSEGEQRFVLSFRSTGENHISSIEFRSGVLNDLGHITLDRVSRYAQMPEVLKNPTYDKYTFMLKLKEMKCLEEQVNEIFHSLGEKFALMDLKGSIHALRSRKKVISSSLEKVIGDIHWLAESNYEIQFSLDHDLSERVIFPVSSNESNGMEDARFVLFTDEDGESKYYATYTAYNGKSILPQLLSTKDFLTFQMTTLNGRAVKDKGMALFPRKVNGKYMMISRIDGENLYIMESDNIHFWQEAKLLKRPQWPWEIIQIGNCGSPIETKEGWLLLTHGVGPMRRYSIGVILLDLEDPARVIGVLEEPLITPSEDEREGYVPNVVYSCGGMIHNGNLVISYAMSDTHSGFATVSVEELFTHLKLEVRGER